MGLGDVLFITLGVILEVLWICWFISQWYKRGHPLDCTDNILGYAFVMIHATTLALVVLWLIIFSLIELKYYLNTFVI